MKINAYQCPKCQAVVFSRTRHDYRWCPCETIAVDGGLDYARVVYNDMIPERMELNIDVTREELYTDWNRRSDKWGIVHPSKDTSKKKRV